MSETTIKKNMLLETQIKEPMVGSMKAKDEQTGKIVTVEAYFTYFKVFDEEGNAPECPSRFAPVSWKILSEATKDDEDYKKLREVWTKEPSLIREEE